VINPFNLGKTESDVSGQVNLLNRELERLEAARRETAQLESQAAYSSGSGYGAQGGYGRADGFYGSDRPGVSYGAASTQSLEERLKQVQEAEARALALVRGIVTDLKAHAGRTESFRRDAESDLGSLATSHGKLHGEHQKVLYRGGEAALRRDIDGCDRILNSIESALRRVGSVLSSGASARVGRRGSGLEDIVGDGVGAARNRAHEGYVENTLQSATIYLLDTGRYGRFDEVADSPRPDLGSSEHARSGSLSDKVAMGDGYAHWPAGSTYSVDLPDFYYRVRRRGYSQRDHHGRYVLMDHYG